MKPLGILMLDTRFPRIVGDIGNAASAMTARMTAGVPQADGSIAPEPTMDVAHVARQVVQMAELPLDVNVQFITIMATTMPYIGRG